MIVLSEYDRSERVFLVLVFHSPSLFVKDLFPHLLPKHWSKAPDLGFS